MGGPENLFSKKENVDIVLNHPPQTLRERKECGAQTMAWGPWIFFRPMYSQMNWLIENECIIGLLFFLLEFPNELVN
jgi:hypothetical protein